MEEATCKIIQLDDYRLVLCDCCISPVRRKDLSVVSRLDHEDRAEICQDCVTTHFDEDNYRITKKG